MPTEFSTSKFAGPKPCVAGVERSEPPEIPPTGGSLRSTPATPRSNLEVLEFDFADQSFWKRSGALIVIHRFFAPKGQPHSSPGQSGAA